MIRQAYSRRRAWRAEASRGMQRSSSTYDKYVQAVGLCISRVADLSISGQLWWTVCPPLFSRKALTVLVLGAGGLRVSLISTP